MNKFTEQSKKSHSILDGVENIINRYLFGNYCDKVAYRHKKAASKIRPLSEIDSKALLSELLREINGNLQVAGKRSSSRENWRVERPQPYIAPKNISKEVRLERALAQNMKPHPHRWWNQMPIASGLVGPNCDRRRAVDLVHCEDKCIAYDFIELKIGSDTPLFALMEIVLYGLIYIAVRNSSGIEKLSDIAKASPVLSAKRINLRVLAPKSFFKEYQLGTFERHLNEGFEKLLAEQLPELQMVVGSYWHDELTRWNNDDPGAFPGCIEDLFDIGSWQAAFGITNG